MKFGRAAATTEIRGRDRRSIRNTFSPGRRPPSSGYRFTLPVDGATSPAVGRSDINSMRCHLQRILRFTRLVVTSFGWRGLVRRATYLARLRSGELRRRLPTRGDFSETPSFAWRHRFDLAAIRRGYGETGIAESLREQIVADAERVLAGELQLYGDRWHNVGWPPRWHRNAFTGFEYPRAHWTCIEDNAPAHGDIKDVWELSRFPFTYLLARAYVLTGDDRYVEAWWGAVEDWARENPPNLGVNWRCGQEASLRGISLCFGLSVFADHPATDDARLDLVNRIIGASVDRVRPTVGYALSQRNNHAVSELAFLLSVGADGDRQLLRLLLEVLADQFYPDGSYSQQSFTYQRLAGQALQWLLATRPDLPPGARSRVVDSLARSRDFLDRCSDPVSGWMPNYGANDGAQLFHLSGAHYRDFRPFLASLGLPLGHRHQEAAIWLSTTDVTELETDACRQPSTYYTLRGPRSLAFTRLGMGHHRPGHADQQSFDLWLDGHNVVPDAGTFRYTAREPWGNPFTGPAAHVTLRPRINNLVAVGRFLQESGAPAEVVHRCGHGAFETVVSRRLTNGGWLWRAILRRGDAYAVVDTAENVAPLVRWHINPTADLNVAWFGNRPARCERDDAEPLSGWMSTLYGSRSAIDVHEAALEPGTASVAAFTKAGDTSVTCADALRELAPWFPAGTLDLIAGTDPDLGTRPTTSTALRKW